MKKEATLSDSTDKLNGVGKALQQKLHGIGIHAISDILFHLPIRYEDRTRLTLIRKLSPQKKTLIEGVIEDSRVIFQGRRSLICRVSDETGSLQIRFFFFNRAQQLRLSKGNIVRCFGNAHLGRYGMEMIHPECKIINPNESPPLEGYLSPVYPTTEGLHQNRLRSLLNQAFDILKRNSDTNVADILPKNLLSYLNLPSLVDSLRQIHYPAADESVTALIEGTHPAQRRLVFEELLAYQLSLKTLRKNSKSYIAPKAKRTLLQTGLKNTLPFELTKAQLKVIEEIDHDLKSGAPMLRLLQGDVGSGKTVVAAMAMANIIDTGHQAAFMAPTELLAEQHYQTIKIWFEKSSIPVFLLTSKLTAANRKKVLLGVKDTPASIVIGTHALFQDAVLYNNLGIIVVDEQHRFGVEQRLALMGKGAAQGFRPHQLIMTATPIPRTLAMAAYADLDISTIKGLPPNRKPIKTAVIPEERRQEIISRISAAIESGTQVYWVCPLIEDSEKINIQSAIDTAENLAKELAPYKVGLIHGKIAPDRKESIMRSFSEAKTDLLVATTVIEVGVDVPNASLIVIENAERLGLAQLHQLRGRVGRGEKQSSCLLVYKSPLTEIARQRLETIRATNDGFEIADRDMHLRGPGELLGTKQAGVAQFKIADLTRDIALIDEIQKIANKLLEGDPHVVEELKKRWLGRKIEFARI
jgi:ATP-dependent DNA helicase RecG